MTTNNNERAVVTLPDFGGINDITSAARNALAECKRDETKGENALWPVVAWVAARAGQMVAQGSLVLGDWMHDRSSENVKAFINAMLADSGVAAPVAKDAGKKERDARRADIARVQRASHCFLAMMVLSDRHGIGADFTKRRVPAIWYVDGSKYTLTNPRSLTAFVARADVVRFHATEADDPEGNGDMIAIRPSVTSTLQAAWRTERAARADGGTAVDVSDASVKDAADVIASRLARDNGAPTGEAADALESVYAALVANDATWSLLVALRSKHERDAAASVAIANGEPA